jgi:DNA-binding IclR family transcriptional regulator
MRYMEIIENLLSPPPGGAGGQGWTAQELIEDMRCPASSMYTYLNRLQNGGYVEKHGTVYRLQDWFAKLMKSYGSSEE